MSKPQTQYDPVAWIERLREVNEGSAFEPEVRDLIDDDLSKLQRAVSEKRIQISDKT